MRGILVRAALGCALLSAFAGTAAAASPNVVVSELRFRGPAGAADEIVELYNASSAPVAIGGYLVKGSNSSGFVSTRATVTAGTILNPGCHYLLGGSTYSGGVAADQSFSTGITDDGGVAVTYADGTVVDAVGLSAGSAFKEGTPLASLGGSNLNRSYERKPGGAAGSGTDTDNNASDFQLIAPSDPQNLLSACIGSTLPTSPTGTGAATPATVEPGETTLLTVAVVPGSNPTSTGLAVAADLSPIGGAASQQLYDDGTHGDASAGDDTFSFLATVDSGTSAGGKSIAAAISDAEARTGSATIALTVAPPTPVVHIHTIQGAAQVSPLSGQLVANVRGIVTGIRSNGFYMQDPEPDADAATSEGIFVFKSSPAVSLGDLVRVDARVSEFIPGGSSTGNLPTTELSSSPVVSVLSQGNSLPVPVVASPPNTVIEDDSAPDVRNGNTFDPAQDGLDYWESLEGMRVEVDDPVAVGPQNSYGELPVATDGAGTGLRTVRGGVLLQPADGNPERLILDDAILPTPPAVNVGDHFDGPAVGVLDYNFGNFMLELTQPLLRVDSGLQRETTAVVHGLNTLTVATFNVENLDPTDPQSKFDGLAGVLVDRLGSPDVVALEEVQDNNGATDDGTVDSSLTLSKLADAVVAAGGPQYAYRWVDPVNDEDGGEPGGNIRVVLFVRTDVLGLSFAPGSPGGPTDANAVVGTGDGTGLLYNPGRIDPASSAWDDSRKPIAGELLFNGHKVFVVANHFNSKGGDDPLMGRFQPPVRSSETQRHLQAHEVADFVSSLLGADPAAKVVVLGDLNDFQFSDTLSILESSGLHDLIDDLPLAEQYTYVFEGNSQALDHILTGGGFLTTPHAYDVVHVNAEFAQQVSDHDPQVAGFTPQTTAKSLCALLTPWAKNAGLANSLCVKLDQGQTGAFRNEVAAQAGKSFTQAQAAALDALAAGL